ncbi:MAG: thioredoxin family protein [Gemmatimonadetes bacterium]|uniref:Thioredoxin family protein n=1 Tax=Candidatus Kutchimonas denitrificans TaxID=3056748 RepID=A0AAE4ZCZ6_9BACT|nr:thioredoxin family protein [Gemmatimonadota bacterium]NIR76436.1 thioredoxin family protein [Candidatus Kutchimonas denitrificans]NIS03255.1 thioredoxin family protein [Gemmatimonadota bacterium]NIT69116.1 thioredoxin family protein [Gemmatimonadota bacterium]NIU54508.1 thioredoxin family protein [Gemmatimonadota bacterium]
MTVELLYFDGCPAEPAAFALLERVLEEENVSEQVQRIAVPGPAATTELRFIGSPSIRIDGVDLEGPDAEDELGFGWRCRQYSESEPGESKAVPSAELIRRRLKERE